MDLAKFKSKIALWESKYQISEEAWTTVLLRHFRSNFYTFFLFYFSKASLKQEDGDDINDSIMSNNDNSNSISKLDENNLSNTPNLRYA